MEDLPLDIHYASLDEWLNDRRGMLEKQDAALFKDVKEKLGPELIQLAKVEVPTLKKAATRLRGQISDASRRLEDSKKKLEESKLRERALIARAALLGGGGDDGNNDGGNEASAATVMVDPPSVMELVEGVHREAERCRWDFSREVFRTAAAAAMVALSKDASSKQEKTTLMKVLELVDDLTAADDDGDCNNEESKPKSKSGGGVSSLIVVESSSSSSTTKKVKKTGRAHKMFPRLCLLASICDEGEKLCTDERCSRKRADDATAAAADTSSTTAADDSSASGGGINWDDDDMFAVDGGGSGGGGGAASSASASATELLTHSVGCAPHEDSDRTVLLDEACALETFFTERLFEANNKQHQQQQQQQSESVVPPPVITDDERRALDLVKGLMEKLTSTHHVEMMRMSNHHLAMEKFLGEVEQTRLLQQRHVAAEKDWADRLAVAQDELAGIEPSYDDARAKMKALQKKCESAVTALMGNKRTAYFVGDLNTL